MTFTARLRAIVLAACMAVAVAVALAGCGGGGGNGSRVGQAPNPRPNPLTIYSSAPLRGDSRSRAQSVVDAEVLALEQAGHRAGRFPIRFVSLDDATASSGTWEPGQTSSNARAAARDPSTIAYLGDLDSGASAVSLPILNEAGILQVSPASTYTGLTRSDGADKDEPDRYYPALTRTFGRVVAPDNVQAAAQVTIQKADGCTALYVLDDQGVYGRGLATLVTRAARARRLAVAGTDSIDPRAKDFRGLAQAVQASVADCLFFAGSPASSAARLFEDMNAADSSLRLYGANALADPAFTSRLNGATQRMTSLTSPALGASVAPPAAQKFIAAFRRRFGRAPEQSALFGYEAMNVVLAAIRGAGDRGNDPTAVVRAFFQTKDRDSVLGRYSIDQNGDTTLSSYGAYRVRHGRPVFDSVVRTQGA